jgi:hypothetical protein
MDLRMTDFLDWPEAFRPETAPVFTHNEVRSTLSAEVLWPILIRVAEWPAWYPHAADVKTTDGGPDIGPASRFSWKTLGVRSSPRSPNSNLREFSPGAAPDSARGDTIGGL